MSFQDHWLALNLMLKHYKRGCKTLDFLVVCFLSFQLQCPSSLFDSS